MQTKIKILHYKIALLFVIIVSFSAIRTVHSAEPAVGAVNNWISVSNATRLSVDMTPNHGEDGYHFYSLSTFFQDQNYGLYTGIQTNGNLGNGVDVGNIFIFSVWNATIAYPENGATATPFGGEGIGYSLRIPYNWTVGKKYRLSIQRHGVQGGRRWSATISDVQSGSSLKIGEIPAPPEANELSGGSAFHERYQGFAPSCTQSSSNLEAASVIFSNLSSDKTVKFSGSPSRNNVFNSGACSAYIHSYSDASTAVTGFGITQASFNKMKPSNGQANQAEGNPSNNQKPDRTPQGPSSQANNNKSTDSSDPNTDQEAALNPGQSPAEESDLSINQPIFLPNNETEETSSVSSSKKNLVIAAAAGALTLALSLFVILRFHILKI